MVNAEKHKTTTAKFGMLPIENEEYMHRLHEKIINETNENPQSTIDALESLNSELNKYYDSVSGNNGGVLKTGTCQRILEIYENVFVIKYAIQYNYHMLTIDAGDIKTILQCCDTVLNCFMDIQARQNKNIDKKLFGGMLSVKLTKTINNTNVPEEDFENVVRLETPISLSDGA